MSINDLTIPLILGLIMFLDGSLMLYARKVFPSRSKRSLILDLPSIPFAATAWLGRVFYSRSVVDDLIGALIVLLVGSSMILWEIVDGFPVHPLVAVAVGALTGMLFWP